MPITVREVNSKKELRAFVRFQHELYGDCPQWVPSLDFDELNTLDREKNPSFEYCRAKYWLAFRDGRVVGRIAGIINEKSMAIWKNRYARFGWVDFIDDPEVSGALFAAVETWAKENGLTGIQGPLGFTDMDKEGMLVEGFGELGTLIGIYNYPYYPEHLEKLSYRKEVDWMEFQVTPDPVGGEKIERLAGIVEKRYKLKALKLKKKDVMAYAKDVFTLLNECYGGLFGFVPLNEKQMAYYTKQYFSFIRPDFVQLVLDGNNKLAGFGITMPSLSKALRKTKGKLLPFGIFHLLGAIRKNDKADLMLVAVRPDMQGRGVNAIIMREGYRTFVKNGIGIVEAAPQLETNKRVHSFWDYFPSRQHKRRRVFTKVFQQ
jgi:hypothetical protein